MPFRLIRFGFSAMPKTMEDFVQRHFEGRTIKQAFSLRCNNSKWQKKRVQMSTFFLPDVHWTNRAILKCIKYEREKRIHETNEWRKKANSWNVRLRRSNWLSCLFHRFRFYFYAIASYDVFGYLLHWIFSRLFYRFVTSSDFIRSLCAPFACQMIDDGWDRENNSSNTICL